MKTGDRIIVSCKLVRRETYVKEGTTRYKKWVLKTFHPKDGIFLGYRTISNGRTYYEQEAGYIYTPEFYHKVALVALMDGRVNPFYAELDCVRSVI